jgi:UDP-N-acetylmuramate dehydrogenase
MTLHKNYSLKDNNTFRVDVTAKYFAEINSADELNEVLDRNEIEELPILALGDGANILFTKDFYGIVLKIKIKGIKVISENETDVIIESGAGEEWDSLVKYAVKNNFGGIENMALIPGTVGAAAVGNIAAYNENLIDVFESLDACDLSSKVTRTFSKEECEFTYRESVFKNRLKGKFVVTKIRIKLNKDPKMNISYFETGKSYVAKGSLEEELSKIAKPPFSIKNAYDAVSNIRKMKLPDPAKIGTAGSFFKNPIVKRSIYENLKKKDPDLQCYPVDRLTYPKMDDPTLTYADYVKVPAARLLDILGWKGKRIGNVGTFPTQALNVVSYGATGKEILEFTKKMQEIVYKNYKIQLEPEVVIL